MAWYIDFGRVLTFGKRSILNNAKNSLAKVLFTMCVVVKFSNKRTTVRQLVRHPSYNGMQASWNIYNMDVSWYSLAYFVSLFGKSLLFHILVYVHHCPFIVVIQLSNLMVCECWTLHWQASNTITSQWHEHKWDKYIFKEKTLENNAQSETKNWTHVFISQLF